MATMYDESWRLALLANHISFINWTLYLFFRKDRHAEKVKAAFWPFNQHLDRAMEEFSDGLWHAREFYYNKKSRTSSVPVEPKEPALIFLDAEFQARLIAYAHRASSRFHTAAQMIREKVLPLLPDLTKELSTFSDECSTRKRIAEAREKSWIPSFAQDLAWGKKDQMTWKISEIEGLLKDIQAGETLLHNLPAILESLSAHFLRLSKLKGKDLDAMGYSSLNALHSLLKDRSVCLNLFNGMYKMWDLSMMELGTVKLLYPPRTKDHP